MPAANLTRSEAEARAADVERARLRRHARPDPRRRDLLERDGRAVRRDPGHVDVHRGDDARGARDRPERASARSRGQRRRSHPARRTRRRERAQGGRHVRATRTRARACTASSTRSTARSTSTPSSRSPRRIACSRCSTSPTSRPSFRFTVTAPGHWEFLSNAPTPEPVRRRRARHVGVRGGPA